MADPQPESIEGLFHAHYRGLCGFAYRVVCSNDIAEEVVQDLFLRFWEQHEHTQAPPLTKAYLYRAVRNHALDYLRRRRREQLWADRKTLEPSPAAAGADEEQRLGELALAIDGAIARLPERCREIFLLQRQHELSYSDIAQTLGLSVKTVETQMGRALKSLRMSLADFLALGVIVLLSR